MSDTQAPPRLTEPKLVSLAREIAMGIMPVSHILSKLGLTPLDLDLVKEHPRFVALMEQMSAEWGSTLNTGERVKVKAQALVEDTLPELYHLIHDRRENMSSKVEALKLLKTLGSLGERDPTVGLAPERFHLEIHIGEGKPQVIDVTPGPGNLRNSDLRTIEDFTSGVNNGELAGGCDE
jgi:hypothetical protein